MDPSINKINSENPVPEPINPEKNISKLPSDLIELIFKEAGATIKDRNIMSSTTKSWNKVGFDLNEKDFNNSTERLRKFLEELIIKENVKEHKDQEKISKVQSILENLTSLSDTTTSYFGIVKLSKKIALGEDFKIADYFPKDKIETYNQDKAENPNIDQLILESITNKDSIDAIFRYAKNQQITLLENIVTSLSLLDKAEVESLKSEDSPILLKSIVYQSILLRAENEFEKADFVHQSDILSELKKDGFNSSNNNKFKVMETKHNNELEKIQKDLHGH